MALSHEKILNQQLSMLDTLWDQLTGAGLTPQDEVRLDFFYYGKDKKGADSLCLALKDYDYSVNVATRGFLLNKTICVSGQTTPTTLTKEKLVQWIDWMVTAGVEHGYEFDGFGCALPNKIH